MGGDLQMNQYLSLEEDPKDNMHVEETEEIN